MTSPSSGTRPPHQFTYAQPVLSNQSSSINMTTTSHIKLSSRTPPTGSCGNSPSQAPTEFNKSRSFYFPASPRTPDQSAKHHEVIMTNTVRWSYGVGHVLNDLTASCWFSFLLVFLRTVLQLESTHAGLLLLIGQIADGRATPVVGYLSDKTKSSFGKRRLWILGGNLCVALTFPPIFHEPLIQMGGEIGRVIYFALFIILFQDGNERVYLNSLRSIFTILANVTVFVLAFVLFQTHTTDTETALTPADLPAFSRLALLVVGVGAIFCLIFIVGVPEPEPRPKKYGEKHVEWHGWFSHLLFYQTAIIYTCTRLLVNVSQTYMPMFLLLSLEAPKTTIATVPLTVFGAGLICTFLCERLTRWVGSDGLTLLGCFLVLCSSVAIYFLPREHWTWIYAIAVLLGMGAGIVGVSALSLIAQLIGNNCESGAFVYGAMSFTDKIANGSAIMIAELLTPSLTSPEYHTFHRNVMTFVPGGGAILASILLIPIIYRTRTTIHEEYDDVIIRHTRVTSHGIVDETHGMNGNGNGYGYDKANGDRPTERTPLLPTA